MKKRIAIIASVILVVSLGIYIYNEIITKTFRYSTVTEAFFNSGPRDAELIDSLEDENIALLIYKRKDGVYSDHVVAKEANGWTSLSINYKNRRQKAFKNGFIYFKEIQDKSVVQIVITIEPEENIPDLSDSMKSAFLIGLQELDNGRKLLYGFLVLKEKIPDNYNIKIGDQDIALY